MRLKVTKKNGLYKSEIINIWVLVLLKIDALMLLVINLLFIETWGTDTLLVSVAAVHCFSGRRKSHWLLHAVNSQLRVNADLCCKAFLCMMRSPLPSRTAVSKTQPLHCGFGAHSLNPSRNTYKWWLKHCRGVKHHPFSATKHPAMTGKQPSTHRSETPTAIGAGCQKQHRAAVWLVAYQSTFLFSKKIKYFNN